MAYVNEALFEHRFWLQILGDHARFIHSALAPKEIEYIEIAKQHQTVFDDLLQTARTIHSQEEVVQLSKVAIKQGNALRNFKLQLIREMLVGKVSIHLTVTFVNHMVNELEEYMRILHFLMDKKQPPKVHVLHHHLLWLIDAAGHAGAINDQMDQTEKAIKEKSHDFTIKFEAFYLKAVEMTGYLRANIDQFPALKRLNNDTEVAIKIFQQFLAELEEMEMNHEILSSFTPLMADHMYREECYHLTKVAQVSELEQPKCDPTTPRNETS
ncbi:DUF2935 domain-containing protein [Bacillus sp. Marseille-P3661]|uniref:DUF2935 domain-containing protein n=1 Tax=Bacillus sp. Marseille-P3661 TaxID=1936234 RepID=UPI000C82B402|nr:DUF2935 domain-containing protein [Bacillus sp. Marseille-P3661]